MFRKLLATAAIALLALASLPAQEAAKDRFAKPLKVGLDASYPPMESVDTKTKKIVGYDPDWINAVAAEGGFKVELKNVEWKAIFPALEAGDVDMVISSVTISEERKKKYDFSDPYFRASQRLVVRAEDAAKFDDLAKLEGKCVGAQIGTTGAIFVKDNYPKCKLVNFDSAPLGFADLDAGAIDGFVADEVVATQFTEKNAALAKRFKLIEKRYSDEEYGIVVRKGDKELLERLNRGIKAAKEKGVDSDLAKKWFR